MFESDELKQIFIDEATDLVERIRDGFSGFADAEDQDVRLRDVLRAIHTIKGGAGTCDMQDLKVLAHRLESNLLKFRETPQRLNEVVLNKVLSAVDRMEGLLDPEESHVNAVETRSESDGQSDDVNLIELEGGAADSSTVPAFGIFDDPVSEETVAASKQHEGPKPESKAAIKLSKPSSGELIRVPLERIQQNFDVISEIFLTRNQLRYLVEQKSSKQIDDAAFLRKWEGLDHALRKNIGELEHIAMAMRMMPIKGLFRRMETTVRNYLSSSEKKISVEINGDQTELDKKILDSLSEPMIHLVRNAMDHGIESAEERRKLGKNEVAKLRLSAEVVGNEVEIRVTDDGKGIDEEKILESARSKGLDISRVKTRDDALHLIFESGFSTKDQVSEISGRGIGMDAVRNYVESVGGTIAIETEINRGTTFILSLPLGMSVIPALIVSVRGQKFAVSTSDILETMRVSKQAIVENGGITYFERKGEFIPCFDIGKYLFADRDQDRVSSITQRVPLCVVKDGEDLIALQLGELIANVEIVAKPVPRRAPDIPYVTGVSILASGEPAFVISLSKLYDRKISQWRKCHAAA